MRAEQLTDSVTYHGEGAVWHDGWGGLKWVDMLAGEVLSLDDTGGITRQKVGSVAAMVRPRADGGFVVATRRRFVLWNEHGEEWRSEPLWTSDERFNEGSCDPLGRVLCGTMATPGNEGTAVMWRLNLDGTVEGVFDGITISNGLAFTADGTRAYYADTPTGRIDVFDVVDGELTDRRPFVTIPEELGFPDGLCVDAEDGVWAALHGGGAVRHFAADGTMQEIVEIPGVTQVTSCTLGGRDLSTLYVTTSRENLPDNEQPAAGALFTAEVGVRGIPVLPALL